MRLVLLAAAFLAVFLVINGPALNPAFAAPLAPPVQVSLTLSTPNPVGQTGSWQLIFRDEFNKSVLNKNKWVTCYWWASTGCTITNDGELQWYLSSQVSPRNGSLRLRADKKTVTGDGKQYNYVSGMVTTGQIARTGLPPKFTFTYGYVEGRLKVPAGQGLWTAFWLVPIDRSWPPEIDIAEILGNDPTTLHMHFHYKDSSGIHQDSGATFTGTNFSAGWHTFAVDWAPNAITWYVDGIARRNFMTAIYIPSKPLYVIANLAVGGNWPGAPNTATLFPSDLLIDYVRIWKRVP